MKKFKIGDTVMCLSRSGDHSKSLNGQGYVPTLVFTIERITTKNGYTEIKESTSDTDIVWPEKKNGNGGVYVHALRHVDLLKSIIYQIEDELNEE